MRDIVDGLMDYVLELRRYGELTNKAGQSIYDKGDHRSCLERWGKERGLDKDVEFFNNVLTNQHKNRVLIRYEIRSMGQDMWINENSLYRECRSIVINMETEEIIILPFQKFFNLNEIDRNSEENVRRDIENAKCFEVSDKLDGSMQNISMDGDEVVLTGSRGMDPKDSWRIELGYKMITEEIERMVRANPGKSFSFELIHEDNPHVVRYEDAESGLYLTGIRDIQTGVQHSYYFVSEMAEQFGTKVVDRENKTLDDLLLEMRDRRGDEKEGWVLHIDGRLVKVKCDDYVFLHRAIGGVTSPKAIIERIIDGTYDDFYSKVPRSFKPRVSFVAQVCRTYQSVLEDWTLEEFNSLQSKTKSLKEFMIEAQKLPLDIKKYVIGKKTGKEINVLKGKKYSDITKTLIEEGFSIEK